MLNTPLLLTLLTSPSFADDSIVDTELLSVADLGLREDVSRQTTGVLMAGGLEYDLTFPPLADFGFTASALIDGSLGVNNQTADFSGHLGGRVMGGATINLGNFMPAGGVLVAAQVYSTEEDATGLENAGTGWYARLGYKKGPGHMGVEVRNQPALEIWEASFNWTASL